MEDSGAKQPPIAGYASENEERDGINVSGKVCGMTLFTLLEFSHCE